MYTVINKDKAFNEIFGWKYLRHDTYVSDYQSELKEVYDDFPSTLERSGALWNILKMLEKKYLTNEKTGKKTTLSGFNII